jgi:hypothetical protein
MIAPFLVELQQLFDLSLKIINWLAVGLLRRRLECEVGWGFCGIDRSFLPVESFLLLVLRFRWDFLQGHIVGQLLLHHGLQFQSGCLQKGQRLLQLRRQHLLQRHSL